MQAATSQSVTNTDGRNTLRSRKVRESSFELMRIIAMIMVLSVHADFLVDGVPTGADITDHPALALTRITWESVCIVCVNIFVMISGWFGIHPTVRGFCHLMFQVVFYLWGIFLVELALGHATVTWHSIKMCLLLERANWFVIAYIGLYLLAPVVNAFIEKASERTLRHVIICFFIFEVTFGWCGSAVFIQSGYSTLSFIGLYLFARYLHLYGERFSRHGLAIYCVSTLCTVGLFILTQKLDITLISATSYVSPFVITGAAGMILWCSTWHFGTKPLINFLARSAFAVFLIHVDYYLMPTVFRPIVQHAQALFPGILGLMAVIPALCGIYLACVVIDQPRQWLWGLISRWFKPKAILEPSKNQ
ncbi:MAG: acyltransferase [Muribaculaceae bacterium]|nr:acyltransferase family protein [Muribaculaceae bacterium]